MLAENEEMKSGIPYNHAYLDGNKADLVNGAAIGLLMMLKLLL